MNNDLLIAYVICSVPVLFAVGASICLIFGPFPVGNELNDDNDYYP